MKKIEYLKSIKGPEQKTEAWLSLRKDKITTSACGSIIGTCKYNTKDEVLIEKCLPSGIKKKFQGNVATYWGERWEQTAIDLYCKLMGKTNYDFGLLYYEQVDPVRKRSEWLIQFLDENPHLRTDILACSPDGIALDQQNFEDLILIEVKCPYKRKIIPGQLPEQYEAQIRLNMEILDVNRGDFIEFRPADENGPTQINIVRVHRDPEYFKRILPVLNDFWGEVEHWRRNDITQHPLWNKYIKDI
jgi:hypothetical protein